jgi:hypothetical protein
MRAKFVLCSSLILFANLALASLYDTAVLRDRPVLYLKMNAAPGSQAEADLAGSHQNGRYYPASGSPAKTRMPNGDLATVFNGATQYLEIPSSSLFSVRSGGGLTVEVWIRPDTLNFPNGESDGYVHFAGKGESGEHEYALRMYSKTNSANRPNRISGYVFNLDGGLGSGSYFQDAVQAGQWIHVAMVIDNRPNGTVSIFKNGVLRKTTPLSQFDVVPQPGNAPLRIATRDLRSFFKGAIGKFAIYRYVMSESKLKSHYAKMTQ